MSEKAKKKFSLPEFSPFDIVTLLFAGLIVYFNIGIVGKCFNPFVYNDEMGYWTHAAKLAGMDWTGVSKTLAWYSFGYSFMLAPLMMLISDTVALYRSALMLNIAMELVCYFLFIYILRRVFPELGRLPSSFAAAAAILYTSYQMNAGIAFSETALLFVTTLVTFLIVRMVQKPTYVNMTLLGLLCAYLFMVHNRTIGIVASAVLIVGLSALALRKGRRKRCRQHGHKDKDRLLFNCRYQKAPLHNGRTGLCSLRRNNVHCALCSPCNGTSHNNCTHKDSEGHKRKEGSRRGR